MQVCELCHNISVPLHSSNRCTHVQGKALLSRRSRRPANTQRRAAYQSKPAGPNARAAMLQADQFRSAAAPSHWDCHQMNESCKSLLFAKCSTSGDVPSQTMRTSKIGYNVTSCQPGLDHSSSKLSMSIRVVVRLVAQQLEQQRQLEFALPSCRGRF